MDLPIAYGNFLRKKSAAKAVYEINKPLLAGWASAFLAFSCTGFLVTGVLLGYELKFGAPLAVYDEAQYKDAQTAYNNLVRATSVVRDAQNSGVAVSAILNGFCGSREEGITFTELNLTGKKYTLRAQAKDLTVGDHFVKRLDFGKNKTVSLGKQDSRDGYIDFLVTVADKPMAKNVKVPATTKQGGKK